MTQYAARRMAVDLADPEPTGLASDWAGDPAPRHALPDDSGPLFQPTPVRFEEERYDPYTPRPVGQFEAGGLPLYRQGTATPAYRPDGPSGPEEIPPLAYQPLRYPTLSGGTAMAQPAPYAARTSTTAHSAPSVALGAADTLIASFSTVSRIVSAVVFLVVAGFFTYGATRIGGLAWYAAGFAWLVGILGVLRPGLVRPRARIRL